MEPREKGFRTSGGVCFRTQGDNGLSLSLLSFSMVMLP